MRYLPILEELFESDTFFILLIGLAGAFFWGSCLRSYKKTGIAAGISALVYGVCEAASNLRGSYLQQLLLLFLGTAALGALAGFGICTLLKAIGAR